MKYRDIGRDGYNRSKRELTDVERTVREKLLEIIELIGENRATFNMELIISYHDPLPDDEETAERLERVRDLDNCESCERTSCRLHPNNDGGNEECTDANHHKMAFLCSSSVPFAIFSLEKLKEFIPQLIMENTAHNQFAGGKE